MSDVEDVYKSLIKAGLTEEELEQMVDRKAREYKGFLTKKGALFMIAKEQGIELEGPDLGMHFGENAHDEDEIDYDEFRVNISDILEGLDQLVILGRILRVFPPKEFTRKDGTPGMVGNFIITDATGSIKVTLWGEDVKIMQNDYFKEGEIIRVIGAYSKMGYRNEMEVHVGRNGAVQLAPNNVDESKLPELASRETITMERILSGGGPAHAITSIEDLTVGQKKVAVQGTVIQIFPPRTFTKKDETQGRVRNIVVQDATGQARIVFWDEQVDLIEDLQLDSEIVLENTYSRHNDYSDSIELTFGKYSSFQVITATSNGQGKANQVPVSASNLEALKDDDSFQASVIGRVFQMGELKQLQKKDGEFTWLFNFILTDDSYSMKVNAWGEKAVELLKRITEGTTIELRNVYIKYSEYDQARVINTTRKFKYVLR